MAMGGSLKDCTAPGSMGIMSIMGTTAISWKIRMPSVVLPWRLSNSSRF
jgi:hypothetical protein